MRYQTLGRTDLKVSELGFGCGMVGGLLVRGEHKEMVRTVTRAIELGINYFDTASTYGMGQSETNLGLVLDELGAEVMIGTKVRFTEADMENIQLAVEDSVEGSLRRLNRDSVDLIQLHNPIALQKQTGKGLLGIDDLEPVLGAFEGLKRQGKIRFWGITGLGETEALLQAVTAGGFDTIQCCYNLLNSSAGRSVPEKFPFQDYRQIIKGASDQKIGVIAIRVLAAGALSGSVNRHPVALRSVPPIGSGPDFEADLRQAQAFNVLINDGYTESLVETAIRFVISKPGVSTTLVGISDLAQLEETFSAIERGPLPMDALEQLSGIWKNLVL